MLKEWESVSFAFLNIQKLLTCFFMGVWMEEPLADYLPPKMAYGLHNRDSSKRGLWEQSSLFFLSSTFCISSFHCDPSPQALSGSI